MRRWPIALLAVLLVAAALPAPASATTKVHLVAPDDDARFPLPGEVVVLGDQRANKIHVGFRGNGRGFVIRDRRGIRSPDCERPSRRKVRCEVGASRVVDIRGSGGSDRIEIGPGVRRGAELTGGAGNDRLLGGGHNDDISGGRGDDLERGRGGGDLLGSTVPDDLGKDTFRGGSGSDFIFSADGRRDRRIACGGNRTDSADVDRKERSLVTGCEDVTS